MTRLSHQSRSEVPFYILICAIITYPLFVTDHRNVSAALRDSS